METSASKLRKLAQISLRLNIGLLVSFMLAVLFLGTSYWSFSRVLEGERLKVNYHFVRLMGNVHEHELFLLREVRYTNSGIYKPGPIDTQRLSKDARGALDYYEASEYAFSTAFSMITPRQAAAEGDVERRLGLGIMMANFHSSFWSDSSYSAPQMLLLDLGSDFGLAVPAIGRAKMRGVVIRNSFPRVAELVRTRLQEHPPIRGDLRVHWSRAESYLGGPEQEVLAYVSNGVPETLWGSDMARQNLVATTLLELDVLGDFAQITGATVFDSFQLITPEGTRLVGDHRQEDRAHDGTYLTSGGLLVQRSSAPANGWRALYVISYRQLFRDAEWALLAWLGLAALCLGAGLAVLRWQRRRIVAPARQAHQALEESHAFNRTLIHAAPVALCVLQDGRPVVQNSLARQWLGDGVSELVQDWRVSADGQPVEICVIVAQRYLHACFAPIPFQGRAALLCVFNDITSYKEAEGALQDARHAADTANEAKSHFLATMSHEIRTPLYGVMGTLELLGMTELDARQAGYLQTIKSSSHVLLQLISDILDVSKIEAGQMALEPGEFSPLEVAEDLLRNYAAMAASKGLQLYGCIDVDLPGAVLGDSTRIRQVIANLLSNAVKFTDSGRVVLYVRVVERTHGKARLQWQVVDTGPGISQEDQQQLFEPFYQVDNHHHTVTGTGLGLSICRRLCELMDGSLQLVSAPGLGSSFSFELELAEAEGRVRVPPALAYTDEPILVRSPVRELADKLCEWLQDWGASVAVLDESAGTQDSRGVLLELLPRWLPPMDWAGARVQAVPEAGPSPQLSIDGLEVSLYNLTGIARALASAQHGEIDAAEVQPQRDRPPCLGLRVLVAEDNPVNQALLREQLERLGCSVDIRANGKEALDSLDGHDVDVVLTDLNMPLMNGYELARALRAQGRRMPIIAVTANALREEGERCLAAGMDAWLTKPISLHALQAMLEKVLRSTPGGAVSAVPMSPPTQHHLEGVQVPDRLRSVFLATMRQDLAATHAAVAELDLDEVRRLLHRMRGALAVAGAAELVTNCREVESSLESGPALATHPALHALLRRIEQALHVA